MKLFRVSTLIAFSLAVASGTGLFVISQRVQRAEHHLAQMRDQKLKEEDTIRVLRAEWDYLNRPDRLEALADRYLGMRNTDLKTVTSDPVLLTAPVQVASPSLRKSPAVLMPQPAVFRPAPAPSASPSPADTGSQKSFEDLIRDLNDGGGGQ